MSPLSLSALLSCSPLPSLPSARDVSSPQPAPIPAERHEAPEAWPSLEQAPPESEVLPGKEGSPSTPAPRILGISLDRPLYRPGETIWARIFDLGELPESASPRSDVQIALVDARGAEKLRALYKNEGAGAGIALDLPVQMPGGRYTLRATVGGVSTERPLVVASFTQPKIRKELDLLRDSYRPGDEVEAALTLASTAGPLADHPFQVIVQIDGRALPPLQLQTDARGEALVSFSLPETIRTSDVSLLAVVEEGGWTESLAREIPVLLDEVHLEWMPEGGDLVQGLESRVYLRARDKSGEPADIEGHIEDDHGTIVTSFRTLHDGLGRFEITPEEGRSYQAKIALGEGRTLDVPLVEAKQAGCVMRSYDDLDGALEELRIGVKCSTEQPVTISGALRGRAYLPKTVLAGPHAEAVAYLRSPHRERLQGVARVTVSSSEGEPLAERLVYRHRNRSLKIELQLDRESYSPREEVSLSVRTTDPDGYPVPADLSLSVVDDRLLKFADDEHGHLVSQVMLGPWIGEGLPESVPLDDPAWYFDPDERDAGRGLDLVLGTYGWRRFVAASSAPPPQAKARPDSAGTDRAETPEWLTDPQGKVLSSEILGGIGGLIGASGTQIGSGGLGASGGLGGLGSRGAGSGASGFGSGGGNFGVKGEGGIGRVGGDPIILGALDRSLIDEVVKRHMNQIRYCYQRELAKDPTLGGRIAIKFTIARDGTVSATSTKSTTMNNGSVESCINGRFLRMKFPEPRGGGIVIVSYPFVFSPDSSWEEVVHTDPRRYSHVRQYAAPDYRKIPLDAPDHRPTVAWEASVRTGLDGRGSARFSLDDTVTTFRITAEGAGGGHLGRATRDLESAALLSVDLPLPVEVSFGDRLIVPVRIDNRRGLPAEVSLETTLSAPLIAEDGTALQHLPIGARSQQTAIVPIAIPDLSSKATVSVRARAGELTTLAEETLVIAPRGFPARWTAAGSLVSKASHTVIVDEALPGGTQARLTLYTSSVASLLEGMASMVAMPHGCFEQTSSTNHPNVMVLRHLDRTGNRTHASLQVSRREALHEGYRLLSGYQVPSGGFELFGQGPGKEVLSAYGLLQFTQMRAVYDGIDPAMLDRDTAFLLGARDGAGGYKITGATSRYGHAPAVVNDAYITYALVETGVLSSGPEVERTRRLADTTEDPYLLALALLTLQRLGDPQAEAHADRLASLQKPDGSFPSPGTSISASGGTDLLVESTALSALALHRSESHRGALDRSAGWLVRARQGSYGWGGTQATVLALDALSTISADKPPAPGVVAISVDGKPMGSLSYTGNERGALSLDLSAALTPGAHHITVEQRGGAEIAYALEATWRREMPADSEGAPLRLTTAMQRRQAKLGETLRMDITAANISEKGVSSPLARVGIPAGVRVEQRALDGLVQRGEIAMYETRPREIILYWEGFAPREERSLHLDLVTEIPGSFGAPPSRIYPYYTTDAQSWSAGERIDIQM